MDKKLKLIGKSTQTPIENEVRRDVVLPGQASKDFIVTARCRIINVGTRVSFSASDLSGDESGIFTWSTNSNKIRIVNSSGPIVAIEALMEPSAGRDQETVTVVRISNGGEKKTKIIQLTVARIRFGRSSKQSFGYDDYDTPAEVHEHHVSLESSGSTVISVNIEGGAVGTDFDYVFDNAALCKIGKIPASSSFDLSINSIAGKNSETILRAKAKCPSQPEFARIFVNVYPKFSAQVVVAKVADSRSHKTLLRFPLENYSLNEDAANKLREAVVEFNIQNFNMKNEVTDVPFDDEKVGALSFDINGDGGNAFEIINQIIEESEGRYRVVIVRGMKSYYYLSRPAKKGDTQLAVKGNNIFKSTMILGVGNYSEEVEVIESVGNEGYLKSPLTKDHPRGEPLEFFAGGWSSDPVIICEGDATVEQTKWTVIHEVGHAALGLLDVIDPKNQMHFSQDASDNTLRHCPRILTYTANGKENQWDTISRGQKSPSKDGG